jgi:hypothetical protein
MENSKEIKEILLKEATVIQDFKHEKTSINYKLIHHIDAKNNFERYEIQAWINGEFYQQSERKLLSSATENFEKIIVSSVTPFI